MKEIYMHQTLNLMHLTEPDLVQKIVNNSEPKQLKDESYYFIVGGDNEVEDEIDGNVY